jgi:hypothetical protein
VVLKPLQVSIPPIYFNPLEVGISRTRPKWADLSFDVGHPSKIARLDLQATNLPLAKELEEERIPIVPLGSLTCRSPLARSPQQFPISRLPLPPSPASSPPLKPQTLARPRPRHQIDPATLPMALKQKGSAAAAAADGNKRRRVGFAGIGTQPRPSPPPLPIRRFGFA